MSSRVVVPEALLAGFAEVWVRLAGGQVEVQDLAIGRLYLWRSDGGEAVALPDRMYGLANPTQDLVEAEDLPAGLQVHLPPGVSTPDAQPHCLGHHLLASNLEEAWGALRRVGRQGVEKARRMGCRVGGVSDEEYFALSTAKAEALGGRAPHLSLLDALRSVFGSEHVRVQGARWEGAAVAVVLSIVVEGYGMLVDSASDRDHWDKNPNNLAVWEAVSSLVERGAQRVDYGFSPVGAGDARFKDHMGGRETRLFQVRGV